MNLAFTQVWNYAASVRPEEDGRRMGKEIQEKWMILYGPPVEWLIIGKCDIPMASPVRPSRRFVG